MWDAKLSESLCDREPCIPQESEMPRKGTHQELPEKKATKAKKRADNKVPEMAENMEHTLRRLVREKEKKRSQNPSLYR